MPVRGVNPSSPKSDDETKQVLEPVLQRVRRRLLDLSGNNALLNYKHPKASSLRIVDEVPTQVFERLMDGGKLSFTPIPEPLRGTARGNARATAAGTDLWSQDPAPAVPASTDPRERARMERKASQARRDAKRLRCAQDLGIRTEYDLPKLASSGQANHRDGKLQTLQFPEELEDQLRKIHRTATTALEETGANRLHMLFGFVEWSEAGYGTDDRVTRLAPLVLVPVSMQRRDVDRETNTYRYTLERTGEDWSANVTLQEKCRVDFGFLLPDPEDDDETLEHYFGRVEKVLRAAQPEWRLRRFLTLGLVSFGKVLMWRDLDPNNWPANRPIFESAPLRKLLGAREAVDADGAAARAGGVEYPLDQLEEGPGAVPPVVIEADSSQHSALVDVERGIDLVLQGPPGTGKSQTITNLIAASIKHGKRVLFVAEKKAALDVVFTRLRAAGLGEFCLALHSHSTAKREFIAELGHRLALREDPPARPRELGGVTERLLAARETLASPISALHSTFGAVELTPYKIFWRARRLAATIPPEVLGAVRELRLPQVTQASQQTVATRRDMVDDFAGAFGNVRAEGPTLDRHPWAGITHDDIPHPVVEDLLDAARAWRAALAHLLTEIATAEDVVGKPLPQSAAELRDVARAVTRLEPLPPSVDAALPFRLLSLASVSEVQAAVEAVRDARARWTAVEGAWGTPGALAPSDASRIEAALKGAAARFAPTDYVATVRDVAGRLRSLIARLASADRIVDRLVDALGGEEVRTAQAGGRSAPLSAAAAAGLATVVSNTMKLDPVGLELIRQRTDDVGARERIAALATRAATLRAERSELDARFQPSFRPALDMLRMAAEALSTAPRYLPMLFSSAYRNAVRTYRAMSGGAKVDRETMTRDVRGLVAHLDAAAAFSSERALTEALGPHAGGMDSPLDSALAAAGWHEEVREATRPLGDGGRDLAAFVRAGSPPQWVEAMERVRAMDAEWDAAVGLTATLADARAAAGGSGDHWHGRSLKEVRADLTDLLSRCESLVTTAESAGLKGTGTLMALTERFARVQEAWRAEERVAARAEVLSRLGVVTAGAETNVEPLAASLQYIGRVNAAGLPAAVERWLLEGDARDRLGTLKDVAARLAAGVERSSGAAVPLLRDGRLDVREWIRALESGNDIEPGSVASVDHVATLELIRRLDLALARERALYPWAVYRRSRATALANGLEEIVALVEAERLGRDHAGDAYEAAFYRNLANAALRQLDVLNAFDSGVHTEVRQRFARLDAERETLMRRQIAAQLSRTAPVWGCAGPRVGDMTEEPLIRHQAGLQRRHLAIRELFRRAGRAIQSLKPCFLMGPQAVAQYLPPGEFEFDLVVMDEASQMRPEDALGAIARGKQVLIVGDPMQLGPSRFFDRMDAGDDDESPDEVEEEEGGADGAGNGAAAAAAEPPTLQSAGATVLERSESILLAAASCLPVRMLRWHYRSRHPRLIAFSNREFYHDRLVVFPTPGIQGNADGVFLQRVEGGLYSGRRNEREAQAVVAEARRHARERPEQTLLIATLNAEQADLVDGLVEEAEKDDPVFGDFRARHEGTQEPFAIKNLENVQGDERDRILVSVTFGPNELGQLRQNFGPINQAGGERRLNVLFTRAKHRLDVFCSFDPNALRVSETTSPRGLRVLRDYLRYATGELWWAQGTDTGREPDSDFEVAVATAIRARGHEVRAQVGVAGYFIDLAVVDPEAPGRFLLGVECDGATYHSAKSARDRDRLRQKQLESLGWTLHRIWSTDWFKDPDGQISRLVSRIEELQRGRGNPGSAA